MKFPSIDEILTLSVADRLRLAHLLWESVEILPEGMPLSAAVREEIDRRLEAFEKDPEAGSSWEDVKSRLQTRK